MKRTTLTASLVGSAAAGLIAAAVATPAWAQATTYPAGTDCSALSNSSSRMDCMTQQNESRQAPDTGSTPSPDVGAQQPAAPNTAPGAPAGGAAAPAAPAAPNGGAVAPGGATGGGAGGGATTP